MGHSLSVSRRVKFCQIEEVSVSISDLLVLKSLHLHILQHVCKLNIQNNLKTWLAPSKVRSPFSYVQNIREQIERFLRDSRMGLFFTNSCTCLWIPLTADTDFYLLMNNANMLLKPKMCCDGEIKKIPMPVIYKMIWQDLFRSMLTVRARPDCTHVQSDIMSSLNLFILADQYRHLCKQCRSR